MVTGFIEVGLVKFCKVNVITLLVGRVEGDDGKLDKVIVKLDESLVVEKDAKLEEVIVVFIKF